MLVHDLRDARRSSGWSQRTLAQRVGCTAQAIQRLEAGVGSVRNLVAVMEALDFHLTGLATGKTLPDQLRNHRRKRSWTIQQTARRTGLSHTTVASLEKGGGSVASLGRLLAALAPNATRRAPERAYWGQTKKEDRDSRFTPPEFMESVYQAFGPIDLDPCAHDLSPVVAHRRIMLSQGGDGLVDEWSGHLAFVNPPYSEQLTWLRRAHQQWAAGHVETVVCLVPFRPDSPFYHDTLMKAADLYPLRGRVKFLDVAGRAQSTPFSLVVVLLGATPAQKNAFSELVPGSWFSLVA